MFKQGVSRFDFRAVLIVRSSAEGVGLTVLLSFNIMDPEVISGYGFRPSDKSAIEFFSGDLIKKILIVSIDFYRIFRSFVVNTLIS